jgi:hypothetical protein
LKAACGMKCGEHLLTTMHAIDAATVVWERDEQHFTSPVPTMLTLHWKTGPIPAFLQENRQNYQRGWDAAKRAIAVATPEGKSYAEYWAKRMEFSVKFIDAVEAIHRAANAEAAHQAQEEAAQLKISLAAVKQGIEAYASVTRNQTDRGAIALAVEYGYRTLEKKLAALNQAGAQ